MKYKITTLLGLAIFKSFSLHAQDQDTRRLTDDYSSFNPNLSGAWISPPKESPVKGSIYLYEDWDHKAVISTKDDKNLVVKGLNFDTSAEQFVAKIAKDTLYVFNNSDIVEVRIGNERFKKFDDNGYFKVLGIFEDFQILKKVHKRIKQGNFNPMTQVKAPDFYVEDNEYFMLKNDALKEFRLTNNKFSKLFGENSKEVKRFMRERNIDIKDDRNIQIVMHYASTL